MTQCEECGARNAENATFCVRCGAELTHSDERPVGEDTDTIAPVSEEAAPEPEPVAAAITAATEAWDAPEAADDGVLPESAEGEAGAAAALLQEASERLSDGDPDTAAAKCREAIDVAPDLVAAYSLLGMAEEQRGNTVAAAGAYRRVLQLDPERNVEREKLELLYAEGAASRPGTGDDERGGDRILAWAPWIAAVAAAFFVMMTLTAVGLRVHAANEAERVYATQMEIAEASLKSGDYVEAAEAFEKALAARPDDEDAQRGVRYARRKMTPQSTLSAAGASGVGQQTPYQAAILPPSGPNPFPEIPIGPARQQPDQSGQPEPAQGQPPRTTSTRTQPPPVMSTDETVEVTRSSQQTTPPRDATMPFEPEVLDSPPDEPQTDVEETSEPEEPAQEKPQGEITIWRSPGSSSQSQSVDSPPQRTSSSEHADRAYALRRQAQAAISRGNCEQGRQLLDQAIEQYRADTAANPARSRANQAAVQTCQTLRQQCESGEEQ